MRDMASSSTVVLTSKSAGASMGMGTLQNESGLGLDDVARLMDVDVAEMTCVTPTDVFSKPSNLHSQRSLSLDDLRGIPTTPPMEEEESDSELPPIPVPLRAVVGGAGASPPRSLLAFSRKMAHRSPRKRRVSSGSAGGVAPPALLSRGVSSSLPDLTQVGKGKARRATISNPQSPLLARRGSNSSLGSQRRRNRSASDSGPPSPSTPMRQRQLPASFFREPQRATTISPVLARLEPLFKSYSMNDLTTSAIPEQEEPKSPVKTTGPADTNLLFSLFSKEAMAIATKNGGSSLGTEGANFPKSGLRCAGTGAGAVGAGAGALPKLGQLEAHMDNVSARAAVGREVGVGGDGGVGGARFAFQAAPLPRVGESAVRGVGDALTTGDLVADPAALAMAEVAAAIPGGLDSPDLVDMEPTDQFIVPSLDSLTLENGDLNCILGSLVEQMS